MQDGISDQKSHEEVPDTACGLSKSFSDRFYLFSWCEDALKPRQGPEIIDLAWG